MFRLEGRCCPSWGLWYYVPWVNAVYGVGWQRQGSGIRSCQLGGTGQEGENERRFSLADRTQFLEGQPHIILKALGNRGQRVLKIKGEGDKATRHLEPTGQAGRAQLSGISAGWTAYLRLRNRDISQAWVWGKKLENQVFKLSSLNGSYGYKGLRIKFLAELGVAVFKCFIQSVMLDLKFFLPQIRFTSRKENRDGHISSPNMQHPPSCLNY